VEPRPAPAADRSASSPRSPNLLILVGFMGAGKSSVGRLLARRLGRCFLETDDIITSLAGRSIPEIFREEGEGRFRELEGRTLESLGLKRDDVVATGGGLPCHEGRMEALRALGTVIWLKGEFGEMYERARREGVRPMLLGRTPAEVEALYRQREPYYGRSHLTIETGGAGIDQVVARILAALRKTGGARL
jgi:shikimate kinase